MPAAETMTLALEARQAISAIHKLQSENKKLEIAALKIGKSTKSSSKESVAALARMEAAWQKNNAIIRKTDTSIARMGKRSNKAQGALTQLSFAADDFSNIISAQGMNAQGFAMALRAVGNNASTAATSFSPLLGMMTGIGVAGGAFAITKLFGGATEELKRLSKNATETTSKIKALQDELDAQRMGQEAFAERSKRQKEDEQLTTLKGRVAATGTDEAKATKKLAAAKARAHAVLNASTQASPVVARRAGEALTAAQSEFDTVSSKARDARRQQREQSNLILANRAERAKSKRKAETERRVSSALPALKARFDKLLKRGVGADAAKQDVLNVAGRIPSLAGRDLSQLVTEGLQGSTTAIEAQAAAKLAPTAEEQAIATAQRRATGERLAANRASMAAQQRAGGRQVSGQDKRSIQAAERTAKASELQLQILKSVKQQRELQVTP